MPAADPYRSRLDTLLAQALELPSGERETLLDQACTGEPGLRRDVDELLRLAGDTHPARGLSTLIGGPLWRAFARDLEPVSSASPGAELGPWRIVRELGRGGMGTVYLAERADGAFALQAALKLLRPGADSEEIHARFERERQILARIQHPNVARLLDGGRTPDGRPFFVMEYVEGSPIDRYCAERRLGLDQRLELLLKVGRAVQHAHRNLVVHRDLKPANIVVTADGDVKLLDFGIAKLLVSEGDSSEPLTRTVARVLTPEYASPEQVAGQPITTASDVYQLGLLMYELLTGRRAQGRQDTRASLQEVVCEREPARPSAVSPALARALRGDLDNIVLMALRKEPERRYGSVEQMMDDIERYRRGLPVRARPDTLAYRTQKFVRRHAVGVATVAAFGLVLVSYAATVTHQARQLSRERDRAQTEARKAERVRDFLVGLFEAADPSQAKGEQVTAAELVDAGARQAREGLAAEPEVQAEMLGVLGKVLHERASYARAEPLLAEALAIQRRLHPDGHVDLARALDAYVAIVIENGDLPRAEQLAREALAMRRRLFDAHRPEVAEGLEALSVSISLQGRFVEAEAVLREALAIRQRLPGQDAKLAETWNDLGVQLAKQRRHVEAEAAYRTGIAIERRVYPPDHPNIAAGLGNLAVTLQQRGRFDEAEALYRETLEARRRVFGSEHPLVGNVLFNIASLQRRRGRTAEAVATHREALAIRRKAFGEKSSQVALSWHGLASALRDAGRPAEAEPLYREAITVFRATGHWAHGVCALNLGRLLVAAGQLDEGERLLNEALAVSVAREGDASVTADEARLGLGLCRAAQRRPAEARQMLEPTLARLRGRADPEPGLVAEAEAALARLPE